ncbi:MAG: hypothetical protein ACLFNV_03990 [Desulfovibrionales bacterium]
MYAICIDQPDASELARGVRRVQFVELETEHRGKILLCAGSGGPKSEPLPREMVIASAELKDVREFRTEDLEPAGLKAMPERKGYAWEFENMTEIVPFSVREQPCLFDIDIRDDELVPIDLTDYEDHVEYFHKVILPQIESGMGEYHDELNGDTITRKRTIREK